MEWTGVKTRTGAQKTIDRLIDLKILDQKLPRKSYGRTYVYHNYLEIFLNNDDRQRPDRQKSHKPPPLPR